MMQLQKVYIDWVLPKLCKVNEGPYKNSDVCEACLIFSIFEVIFKDHLWGVQNDGLPH